MYRPAHPKTTFADASFLSTVWSVFSAGGSLRQKHGCSFSFNVEQFPVLIVLFNSCAGAFWLQLGVVFSRDRTAQCDCTITWSQSGIQTILKIMWSLYILKILLIGLTMMDKFAYFAFVYYQAELLCYDVTDCGKHSRHFFLPITQLHLVHYT